MFSKFKNLFKRPKSKGSSSTDIADLARSILENEQQTLARNEAAKASSAPYVKLTPSNMPDVEPAGWFGGTPRLPKGYVWPEINGKPGIFVCQIDLTKLPNEIWSRAGPRHGYFAFFLNLEGNQAHLAHVDGGLVRQQGPGYTDTYWARPAAGIDPATAAHAPEWPVAATCHSGPQPAPAGFHLGKHPNFPDPRSSEELDLADPAFHPLNAEMFNLLIDGIDKNINQQKTAVTRFLSKTLKDEDRKTLEDYVEVMQATAAQFQDIKADLMPYQEHYDEAKISAYLSKIGDLPLRGFQFLTTDANGVAKLELHEYCVSGPHPIFSRTWQSAYLGALYDQGRYARAGLPAAQRARLEAIWALEAQYEAGIIGHAPQGHIYTPHGPDSENEVLLELKTSNLLGWCWGDMYSIVFLISRADLAKGRYDRIIIEITN